MTSSVQPPVLNPPIGTPSNEWAKKTASSLDPFPQESSKNVISESQSPGVTPGDELPGAFPSHGQGETSTGPTNITETIVDTAKQYLPTSVMNKVETFLGNNNSGTTGTDKGVRASEHDIYHKASLPSQELRGALPHEHVGGVGSLPGASIEKSVAVLPDEEAELSQSDTYAGRNTPGYQTPRDLKANGTSLAQTVVQKATKVGVASGIVKADDPTKPPSENVGKGYPETITSREIENAQQAVGNIKPVAFDIKPAQDVSMPSTEKQGQQPGEHTGGVGSLPGSKDEQDVAVLPDERLTKSSEMVRPEQPQEPSDSIDKSQVDTSAMGGEARGATDPFKKASQLRDPPTETVAIPSEQRTTTAEPVQHSSASNESDNVAGIHKFIASEGSTESQHKATLKEKISGGMKVVSGKLGHDKSKVEEGKKLMSGQPA